LGGMPSGGDSAKADMIKRPAGHGKRSNAPVSGMALPARAWSGHTAGSRAPRLPPAAPGGPGGAARPLPPHPSPLGPTILQSPAGVWYIFRPTRSTIGKRAGRKHVPDPFTSYGWPMNWLDGHRRRTMRSMVAVVGRWRSDELWRCYYLQHRAIIAFVLRAHGQASSAKGSSMSVAKKATADGTTHSSRT